jgi:DNA-3-methyladenine glycosylase II
VTHIRQVDGAWSALIDHVGPCKLRPRKERFGTLVRAIIGQQISSKAAQSIDARLRLLAGDPHTPGAILEVGEAGLRSVGLSGVKARYVLNLSEAISTGAVPLQRIGRHSDEAIVERLTTIKGIGVWTAEMFLIFALNRPDILPVADLGVRVALRNFHGLSELPGPAECRALTEHLRPFRSVASWYLWRTFDTPKPPAVVVPPAPAPSPTVDIAPPSGRRLRGRESEQS